jgi:nucleolar protein 4
MEALAAVSKLHAHVFKGALLSATLKKRIDAVPGLSKTTASSSGMSTASAKSKAASRASRLIIRNLPWDITEQDLRALFLPYGPIHSVHIPSAKPEQLTEKIVEDGQEDKEADAKPRARGFAFVWMVSKPDAAKALEGVNGTTVRAGIAARMAEEKQKKKKELRLERKKTLVAEGGEGEDGQGKAQEQEGAKERIVAVDWALSKNKWEEEKTRLEDQVDVDGDESMEGTSSGSSSSSSEGDSDEDGGLGVDDDSDSGQEGDSDEEGDDSERDDDEAPVKPQLPQTDVGTTLFVRNVPYEGTEDELRQLYVLIHLPLLSSFLPYIQLTLLSSFRAFGPLRYARITIDPASGRGRGTGFACFWNKEDADKALAFSDTLRADSGFLGPVSYFVFFPYHDTSSLSLTKDSQSEKEKKKNPFKLPTLLTPDPSSSIAQSLVLHGRTLDLSRAVTRDEADKLKEQGERAREKKDKRNLYLLREGGSSRHISWSFKGDGHPFTVC